MFYSNVHSFYGLTMKDEVDALVGVSPLIDYIHSISFYRLKSMTLDNIFCLKLLNPFHAIQPISSTQLLIFFLS
jgi:hypothetical protein